VPGETTKAAPAILERELPRYDEDADIDSGGPHVVILYNCDCHTMDQVVEQLLKATDYPLQRCIEIMHEAHLRGRAIAYTGSAEACDRAARILRQIRLQVETDAF
jgi:ATP-dependent Clp protease adapter protein ClpS